MIIFNTHTHAMFLNTYILYYIQDLPQHPRDDGTQMARDL